MIVFIQNLQNKVFIFLLFFILLNLITRILRLLVKVNGFSVLIIRALKSKEVCYHVIKLSHFTNEKAQ